MQASRLVLKQKRKRKCFDMYTMKRNRHMEPNKILYGPDIVLSVMALHSPQPCISLMFPTLQSSFVKYLA